MQVIQTIRDKGAAVVIAVIALSLIGFLLMDAKSGSKGSGGFLSSLSSNVGKVNGQAIEKSEFDKKYTIAYDQDKEQSASTGRSTEPEKLREQVWNQIVNEMVFFSEAEKLGIDFTSKELSAFLASDDPSNPLLQDKNMIDPATGKLDQLKMSQALNDLKKAKDKRREMIDARLLEPQKIASTSSKYFALLNASAYYPTWMQEKDKAESKTFANISFVNIPYNVISDSTIKVTDDEINSYVEKHKNQFKQEAGRMISYVSFSQIPNADDSAKTKEFTSNLKQEFATDTNTANFLARNGSSEAFDKDYIWKTKMQGAYKDSIIGLPKGGVFGPYIDGNSYTVAKLVDQKQLPDSVLCRHILIKIADLSNGQISNQIRPDTTAKKLIDSIAAAIKNGADFNEMVLKYSDDPGSKTKKGEYSFNNNAQLVDSFYRTVFYEPVGTKKVVLGVDNNKYVGYHYIEVLNQFKFEPAYKVAYLVKEIAASKATIDNANLNATKLSGQKNAKEFESYIAKNGLQKVSWPAIIKENDFSVGQLQDARQLVKWAFDANQGDVSDPFNIGNQFIVATVDKIQSEGTKDAKTARPLVEGVVRQQKEADAIIKTLGANPTFEKAAADYKQPVQVAGADSTLTFSSQIIANVGPEPKVIGASFNKENQNKISAPIQANSGVFLIKVNSVGTKPADTPEAEVTKKTQQTATLRNQVGAAWFEGLKDQATIKDSRSKYGY